MLSQDTNYNYQQSCELETMHQTVSALGCFDFWISVFMCGLDTERKGPDWSETSITGNIFYPRLLVSHMPDINGDNKQTPEMSCSDPFDCA